MVRRRFPDRAAVLGLDEQAVVNCMGFAAKAIWDDRAMVPVRGQIGLGGRLLIFAFALATAQDALALRRPERVRVFPALQRFALGS